MKTFVRELIKKYNKDINFGIIIFRQKNNSVYINYFLFLERYKNKIENINC